MKKNNPEAQVQAMVTEWFHLLYPQYLLFSIPNEATFRKAQYFKSLGMLSGVSDMILVLKNKVLFLEFKDIHGRQSDTQKQFQVKVELLGFEYHIIRDLQDVKQILRNNLPVEEWQDL